MPRFWWRRIARIWPLHLAILVVMILFALLLLATGRDASGYPLGELPLHLLLVQNWGFTEGLSWNHPAWSISTEAGAYLLFPFVVLVARWERLPPALMAGLGALLSLGLHMTFALAGEGSLGARIPELGLPRCLFEFAIGMVLANLWQAWRGSRGASLASTVAGGGLLATGMVADMPQTLFLAPAFALLLLALALTQDNGPVARVLASRPLRWLGDTSYATYLAHFPLFILAKLLFVGDDLQISPAGFAAYLAMLLVLSGALYRWLEKPAQTFLNRRGPSPHARRLPT